MKCDETHSHAGNSFRSIGYRWGSKDLMFMTLHVPYISSPRRWSAEGEATLSMFWTTAVERDVIAG